MGDSSGVQQQAGEVSVSLDADGVAAVSAVTFAGAEKALTDCRFFLLGTCVKGAECEFRHSFGALANVVPCKFWLAGTCRNPMCPYRHPPKAGAVGAKTQLPCLFYNAGRCNKGAACPFSHNFVPGTLSQQGAQQTQPQTQQQTQQLLQPQEKKKAPLRVVTIDRQQADQADSTVTIGEVNYKGHSRRHAEVPNPIPQTSPFADLQWC
eukprot:TRINITY_DN6091_c0_g2_i2.p3 TRINITY_DN6091_c0_g2~~TRINITY_DN6091_c0_g2_i2.p3  ORF type:complete len:215 (+),score=50.86 TRINITY_DN6091_c0_g2_i2:22-645(+)